MASIQPKNYKESEMAIGADGRRIPPPYAGVAKLMENPERARRLIIEAVADLDMSGLTVLTEAASGNFLVTPVLAAAAGAQVYAVAKDSEYGSALDVSASLRAFAELCGTVGNISIFFDKFDEWVGGLAKADIVTNLGTLRPIDKDVIGNMKNGSIILCMHEEWEKRDGDVDLKAAKSARIPVLYVEENALFGYCGLLCMKMLFEAGVEVYKNNILVLSGDKYGKTIYKCLKAITGDVRLVSSGPWVRYLDRCDAVVLADFEGAMEVSDDIGVPVVHVVENGRMTKTLGYLGPKPIIDIHAMGFRTAVDKLRPPKGKGE